MDALSEWSFIHNKSIVSYSSSMTKSVKPSNLFHRLAESATNCTRPLVMYKLWYNVYSIEHIGTRKLDGCRVQLSFGVKSWYCVVDWEICIGLTTDTWMKMNNIQLAYSLEGRLTACWWFCQLVWVGTEGKSSSTICTESSLREVIGSVFSCLSSRLVCWSIEFISSTWAWIFESTGGGICVTGLPLCCSVQVDAALYKHVFSNEHISSLLTLSESHCRATLKNCMFWTTRPWPLVHERHGHVTLRYLACVELAKRWFNIKSYRDILLLKLTGN